MYLLSLFPIMQLFDICDFPSKKLYLGYVQKYWFIHVTHLQLFTTLHILKLSCLNGTFWYLNGAGVGGLSHKILNELINQDMSYVTPLLHVMFSHYFLHVYLGQRWVLLYYERSRRFRWSQTNKLFQIQGCHGCEMWPQPYSGKNKPRASSLGSLYESEREWQDTGRYVRGRKY